MSGADKSIAEGRGDSTKMQNQRKTAFQRETQNIFSFQPTFYCEQMTLMWKKVTAMQHVAGIGDANGCPTLMSLAPWPFLLV